MIPGLLVNGTTAIELDLDPTPAVCKGPVSWPAAKVEVTVYDKTNVAATNTVFTVNISKLSEC
jgi:hypothetical protein